MGPPGLHSVMGLWTGMGKLPKCFSISAAVSALLCVVSVLPGQRMLRVLGSSVTEGGLKRGASRRLVEFRSQDKKGEKTWKGRERTGENQKQQVTSGCPLDAPFWGVGASFLPTLTSPLSAICSSQKQVLLCGSALVHVTKRITEPLCLNSA